MNDIVKNDWPKNWPALSLEEAHARLTAPGARFETVDATIRGVTMRVWKHVPATAREAFEQAQTHGAREFLIYQDERITYDAFTRATAKLASSGQSWQPSAAGSGASDPGARGGNRGVPRRERASRGRRGWDWGAWLPATLGPDGANSWRRSAGAWARAAAPSGQRVGAESRPGAGRGGWLVEGWPAEVRLEPGSQGSRPGLGSKATSPDPRAQGLF